MTFKYAFVADQDRTAIIEKSNGSLMRVYFSMVLLLLPLHTWEDGVAC